MLQKVALCLVIFVTSFCIAFSLTQKDRCLSEDGINLLFQSPTPKVDTPTTLSKEAQIDTKGYSVYPLSEIYYCRIIVHFAGTACAYTESTASTFEYTPDETLNSRDTGNSNCLIWRSGNLIHIFFKPDDPLVNDSFIKDRRGDNPVLIRGGNPSQINTVYYVTPKNNVLWKIDEGVIPYQIKIGGTSKMAYYELFGATSSIHLPKRQLAFRVQVDDFQGTIKDTWILIKLNPRAGSRIALIILGNQNQFSKYVIPGVRYSPVPFNQRLVANNVYEISFDEPLSNGEYVFVRRPGSGSRDSKGVTPTWAFNVHD